MHIKRRVTAARVATTSSTTACSRWRRPTAYLCGDQRVASTPTSSSPKITRGRLPEGPCVSRLRYTRRLARRSSSEHLGCSEEAQGARKQFEKSQTQWLRWPYGRQADARTTSTDMATFSNT